MEKAEIIQKLQSLMIQELDALGRLSRKEDQLQRAVMDRDWPGVEGCLREFSHAANELAKLDERRNNVYSSARLAYGLAGSGTFIELLAQIEGRQKIELLAVHRGMKAAISRIQGLTTSIEVYMASTITTVRAIMEELFPERRMRFYRRNGAVHSAADMSLVVNHHS